MVQRVLFLSNGHGEDLNGSLVLQALRQLRPGVEVAAMPIVGQGQAYQRLGVELIGPTQQLPSGGFNYINFGRLLNPVNWRRDHNPLNLLRDLLSGLLALTWGQLRAVQRYSRQCDLLVAVGDVVPILFAYLTRRPFVAFLVSTSSYYEGRAKLPLLALVGLRSQRCLKIFTRDAYTAADLQRRGLNASFLGFPIMDALAPTGKDLGAGAGPVVALLPGSRLPEALENLALQLRLCEQIAARRPVQFQAALVPSITAAALDTLAAELGWHHGPGLLEKNGVGVRYHSDAFADILHRCDLVVGMAGTAVEQAVGLGKPILQIVGAGPQFTYVFAEAQQRLLGESVTTVGPESATAETLVRAAEKALMILQDQAYQQRCRQNGRERIGDPGGSEQIAQELVNSLPREGSHAAAR